MKKNWSLLIIKLFFYKFIFSQNISGEVYDIQTKDPLIGVNVILNNNTGTTTDINGRFTIQITENTETITFKYIGYKPITKKIKTLVSFPLINRSESIKINMSPETQEVGTVVISAGKFEQKIEEITVSMEVIKPSLVENKNTTNIQTAMNQVPGVSIIDGQANIRGGSGWSYGAGSRVLVLVDDMPLVSGDAGQVQWKLIATENINQIEVIKGASSVLYGSSALNGVINIRTSFPKQSEIDNHPSWGYTKINTHFGITDHAKRESLNWWKNEGNNKRQMFYGTEFLHAQKIGKLNLTIGGNYFKDEGYRKDEITDRKRLNFNAKYYSSKIAGLSYGLNGNFLLQSTGSALIWNGYDEAYIPLNDQITTTSGDTYNIDPAIYYITEKNSHSLKSRYLKVWNDNETKGDTTNQDNKSEIVYLDYQWQHNMKDFDLRITSGITNEIVWAIADLFQGNNLRKNHALYSQIDKKINKINISAGARYEYFSISPDKNNPYVTEEGDTVLFFGEGKPVFRTGINYQAGEATYIRSSWGQGYRFPSMAELFITTNVSGLELYPNPELRPESGWTSEIGIKQGIKIKGWQGYLDAAAFIMRYDDMMEFSFGRWGDESKPLYGVGFKSVNVGETQISGFEISMVGQGKINDHLTINTLSGYTYVVPISRNPDEIYVYDADTSLTYTNSSSDPSVLKYRYQHIAKLDVEAIYKKASLGISVRYNDFMKNIDRIFTSDLINNGFPGVFDGVPGINESRGDDLSTSDIESDGYDQLIETHNKGDIIVDVRSSYQMNQHIKISLIVNNLLNHELITRPANMMPPRQIALQCSMKF